MTVTSLSQIRKRRHGAVKQFGRCLTVGDRAKPKQFDYRVQFQNAFPLSPLIPLKITVPAIKKVRQLISNTMVPSLES